MTNTNISDIIRKSQKGLKSARMILKLFVLLICFFTITSCKTASFSFGWISRNVNNISSFKMPDSKLRGDLTRADFNGFVTPTNWENHDALQKSKELQKAIQACFKSQYFKKPLGKERYKIFQKNLFSAVPKNNLPSYQACQYKIFYLSEDYNENQIVLSALLVIPYSEETFGDFSLVEINHATLFGSDIGPTSTHEDCSEIMYAWYLATSGIAVLLPDYPGFGINDDFHPYIQKESLGKCSRDALQAASQFFSTCKNYYENKLSFNEYVAIAGYSEGGYATLACLDELNKNPVENLKIDLVLPMAAPADISGTMLETFRSSEPYPHPFYLPYVLLGWHDLNPDLLDESRIFSNDAIEKVIPVFKSRSDQKTLEKTISDVLNGKPAYTLLSEETQNWIFNPDSSEDGKSFFNLLQQNDLFDVAVPKDTKVKIIASPADDSVPFKNSEKLFENLRAKSDNIELITLPEVTHDKAFTDAWGYACRFIMENKL